MAIAKVVPFSTYRLQFNQVMTFKKAIALVEYLNLLGVSHCYSSPLLKARKESQHGYDIVSHEAFHPEIGTFAEFQEFIKALKSKEMGLIFDVVPNHMYIATEGNLWWADILENGPSSMYVDYFDIDWSPPKPSLENKVLLPFLEQPYGEALEKKTLQVQYKNGAFFIKSPSTTLPTDPKSWNLILENFVQNSEKFFQADHPSLLELKSIVTAIRYLPTIKEVSKEKKTERQIEKEIIKKRLNHIFANNADFSKLLDHTLHLFNGESGRPESFNGLEKFLDSQAYRLSYWRVASAEINYRRFFDVSEYAGIRTEMPNVFQSVIQFVGELLRKGLLDGLRIDHIDGLWDPKKFLFNLKAYLTIPSFVEANPTIANCYMLVEKILTLDETLPRDWPIDGTVGYDFMNDLNGIFVCEKNISKMRDIYESFARKRETIDETIYNCKKLILIVSMSSELSILTRKLESIAAQNRNSRDFTEESLKMALRDIIACFPVYRSYVQGEEGIIHDEDRLDILQAIEKAKDLNTVISGSIFDFIQSVLLLENALGLSEKQINERREFVMRFQQLTGPVMAKGVEDTAFYRYYPLASTNEVGGSLHRLSLSVQDFHKKNHERLQSWPFSMISTSTHDTKRGEDVRARINVLSEMPDEWQKVLLHWSSLNDKHKVKVEKGEKFPSANDEYLYYQTLIGTWPLEPDDQYVNRMTAYMEKAIKEAKVHTSWVNPNAPYDEAMKNFVQKTLIEEKANLFLPHFKEYIPKIIQAGISNSLSQLVLKLTSPGVPDIYQGNEIWDFSLVDPDNRRPVDFEKRHLLLKSLSNEKDIENLFKQSTDGKIKLYLTKEILHLRKEEPGLFLKGEYLPLEITGKGKDHFIAFARLFENKCLIVIAARFFSLLEPSSLSETFIVLPEKCNHVFFRDLFSQKEISLENSLDKILGSLPFALLRSHE